MTDAPKPVIKPLKQWPTSPPDSKPPPKKIVTDTPSPQETK